MVLVLDNYDSFTWNIVHVAAASAPAARLHVVRSDALTVEQALALAPSHLIISPGPRGPQSAGVSVPLVRALAGRIPVLGICLGHQCIGAAFDMLVARHPLPVHGKPSMVEHDGQGLFAGLPSPFAAARYHSLVIDESTINTDHWTVSAWTHDPHLPRRTVMAIRRKWHAEQPLQAPLEGVQFHPESFMTPRGGDILARFLTPLTPLTPSATTLPEPVPSAP